MLRLFFVFWVFLMTTLRPATAELNIYGPFWHTSELPTVLTLTGDIQTSDTLSLHKALREHDEIETIFLLSPGGNVGAALELSAVIHTQNLNTVVPPKQDCASACTFLFVAGHKRRVYGRLGVHQFSSGGRISGAEAEGSAQSLTAQILEYMEDYGVSNFFILKTLETPHDTIHWFSTEELRTHKIETLSTFPAETSAFPDIYAALKDDVPGGDTDLFSATAPATAVPLDPLPSSPTPEPRPDQTAAVPSFDCALARTTTEKTLCADKNLADLDRLMAKRYRTLRDARNFSQSQSLIASQKAWLKRRDACGSDRNCLQQRYATRIRELAR